MAAVRQNVSVLIVNVLDSRSGKKLYTYDCISNILILIMVNVKFTFKSLITFNEKC